MGALCRPGARTGGCRLTQSDARDFVTLRLSGPPTHLLARRVVYLPTAVVCEPTSPAVVIGSTQPESDVDRARCSREGIEVVRRRSGGGAVLVRPGAQVWIDVFIPRGDPRFREDVLESFAFLGKAWRAGLAAVIGAPLHSLAVVAGRTGKAMPWSAKACFAGLGAGEILLDNRKVVGISQRRDRSGAWFHSMAMLDFDPGELPGLLDLSEAERHAAGARLAAAAASVPGGRAVAGTLVSAVLGALS